MSARRYSRVVSGVAVLALFMAACGGSTNGGQDKFNSDQDKFNSDQEVGPTLLGTECSLRYTGMSSSESGTYYSWTYYNSWSDGTKTATDTGQGYTPPGDC